MMMKNFNLLNLMSKEEQQKSSESSLSTQQHQNQNQQQQQENINNVSMSSTGAFGYEPFPAEITKDNRNDDDNNTAKNSDHDDTQYDNTNTVNEDDDDYDDDDDDSSDGIDILGIDFGNDTNRTILERIQWNACKIITSQWYRRLRLLFILLCSIILGLRTIQSLSLFIINNILNTMIFIFQFIFIIEIIIEISYYQEMTIKNGWLILDILLLSIVWIYTIIYYNLNVSSILIMRGFRLLRALRKASLLKTTVKSILQIIPKFCTILIIWLLQFYMFTVLCTDLFQEILYIDDNNGDTYGYFSSLGKSALTLFQIMTGGRLWSIITDELMLTHPYSWMVFVTFCFISTIFFGTITIAIVNHEVSHTKYNETYTSLLYNHYDTTNKDITTTTTRKSMKKIKDRVLLRKQSTTKKLASSSKRNIVGGHRSNSSSGYIVEEVSPPPSPTTHSTTDHHGQFRDVSLRYNNNNNDPTETSMDWQMLNENSMTSFRRPSSSLVRRASTTTSMMTKTITTPSILLSSSSSTLPNPNRTPLSSLQQQQSQSQQSQQQQPQYIIQSPDTSTSSITKSDIQRLECKIDSLTKAMEQIMKVQLSLQENVLLLQQQNNDTNKNNQHEQRQKQFQMQQEKQKPIIINTVDKDKNEDEQES